jgi:cysteine-rich repeat protein
VKTHKKIAYIVLSWLAFAPLAAIFTTAVQGVPTHYYFSSSTGDNANQGLYSCSQAHPCHDFKGTTLDNTGALSCGDTINFKRGDVWEGSEAEVEVKSQGCSGNPIYIQAYGTGENPILAGAAVTSGGWTNTGGGIYSITGQSQTHLKTVAYTIGGSHGALGYWSGTVTTLPAGTYKRSGTTLYIHLPGDADPATSNVRIGNFSHSSGDGSHGLLRGAEDEDYSSYQYFRDITVLGANGVGFSFNGVGDRSAGVRVIGAGQDGFLCWHLGFLGACSDGVNYYDEYAYNAAGANGGGGSGQGWTSWGGPYMWAVGYIGGSRPFSHDNFMAGVDFLDFNAATNVTHSGLMRTEVTNNGLAKSDPSYDANIYADGASEVFFYGVHAYSSGVGSGTAGNARTGILLGSEHPTTKPVENAYVINSLIYKTHWAAIGSQEICYASTSECPPDGNTKPNNNYNHNWINNTILAYDAGTFDMVYSFGSIDPTAHNLQFKNNVIVADSAYVYAYGIGSTLTTAMEADYNIYYRRGGSTNLWASSGGGSPFYTLAGFQSATGEDANSINSDPLLVNNGDSANPALGDGSPAIDAGTETPYTIPAWLPATVSYDIGPKGVRGSTRASGAIDDISVNMDMGYHKDYAGLTSVSVVPSSYVAGQVVTYTVTFTMPEKVTALLYNWKIKFTFPATYTLSSGAASTVSSSTISGTWTSAVSGQSITATRVGDGQSEFPGTYTFTISNVKNPVTAGVTGVFYIETQDQDGIKVAEYYDGTASTTYNQITGITITEAGGGSVCGNSIIEAGESCDDGNTDNLDGCSSTCQTETPTCGNSIVEYLEQCDDGNTDPLDGCSATCQIENPVCGNGIVEYLEQCDDNNTDNGDGCSSTCQTEAAQVAHGRHSGPRSFSGPVSFS